eukprot:TRINITY_DN414_c0_g2_i2.p1 TRINITY_DN414_c0_g2~~TRINITY_DN414_c0_g2_i2.p1  ORF type:complete len:500 (-),score=75.45 TRINITY_DN414_c0_g2_i2:63-1409(-)
MLLLLVLSDFASGGSEGAVVVNTWPWTGVADAAWAQYHENGSLIDSLVAGASWCESEPANCGFSVGYGGSPDSQGHTTLDAMIMDGRTCNVGAVGDLQTSRAAIEVARLVLEHTEHSLIVGARAGQFALELGMPFQELSTNRTQDGWRRWKTELDCQPNFWKDVYPNPRTDCGPYHLSNETITTVTPTAVVSSSATRLHRSLIEELTLSATQGEVSQPEFSTHDTVVILATDGDGNLAAGASSNGATFKIAGRVGDGSIPGSGAYAENFAGACGETGDGDILMRFSPCALAVTFMKMGFSPTHAAEFAVSRIRKFYPKFNGALITMNPEGEIGAATNSDGKSDWFRTFHYSVRDSGSNSSRIESVVECLDQCRDFPYNQGNVDGVVMTLSLTLSIVSGVFFLVLGGLLTTLVVKSCASPVQDSVYDIETDIFPDTAFGEETEAYFSTH